MLGFGLGKILSDDPGIDLGSMVVYDFEKVPPDQLCPSVRVRIRVTLELVRVRVRNTVRVRVTC